jgi:hypothetical protein
MSVRRNLGRFGETTPSPLVKLRVECKYLIGLAVGEHLARSVRVEEEASV